MLHYGVVCSDPQAVSHIGHSLEPVTRVEQKWVSEVLQYGYRCINLTTALRLPVSPNYGPDQMVKVYPHYTLTTLLWILVNPSTKSYIHSNCQNEKNQKDQFLEIAGINKYHSLRNTPTSHLRRKVIYELLRNHLLFVSYLLFYGFYFFRLVNKLMLTWLELMIF